jgi:hypothetical protein
VICTQTQQPRYDSKQRKLQTQPVPHWPPTKHSQFHTDHPTNTASSTLTIHQAQPVPHWPSTIRGATEQNFYDRATWQSEILHICRYVLIKLHAVISHKCTVFLTACLNTTKLTKTVSLHKISKTSHRPRRHTGMLSQPVLSTRDFILPVRIRWDLRSSEMLSSV